MLAQTSGFVFTNASGEVVFTDRGFLRLTKRPFDDSPLAEALHLTLGIEEPSARSLLQDVTHRGAIDRPALRVRTTTGSLHAMRAAAVAVFTGRESFIGADIQLSPPLREAKEATPPQSHADVLGNYARQALEEARSYRSWTYVQVYLAVQIDAIQILLARLGGHETRASLERIVNASALRNRIPIVMRTGDIEFGHKTVPFSAYRTFFESAVEYAVSTIGRRMVEEEMRAIDRRIEPGVLQTARLFGLTGPSNEWQRASSRQRHLGGKGPAALASAVGGVTRRRRCGTRRDLHAVGLSATQSGQTGALVVPGGRGVYFEGRPGEEGEYGLPGTAFRSGPIEVVPLSGD